MVEDKDGNILNDLKTLVSNAEKAAKTGTNLQKLEDGIKTLIKSGAAKGDSDFVSVSITKQYGDFYKKVLSAEESTSALNQILTGAMDATATDSFVAKLGDLYKAEVLTYTQDAYENFQLAANQLAYSNTINPSQKKALLEAVELLSDTFDDENGQFVLTENLFNAVKGKESSDTLYSLLKGVGLLSTIVDSSATYSTYKTTVSAYSITKANNFASLYNAYLTAVAK